MIHWITFFTLVTNGCFEAINPLNSQFWIVGGKPTSIEEIPWQVSIANGAKIICGGSIVSERYILTAAHCFQESDEGEYTVLYGSDAPSQYTTTARIRDIIVHPWFTSDVTDGFDVAVIKLANTIQFSSTAQPVTLSPKEFEPSQAAVVSGWGKRHHFANSLENSLQKVVVFIVDLEECARAYEPLGFQITDTMFCASAEGRDACGGDSGGPITVRNSQVGIVSWGQGCADPRYPGVYASVMKFRRFIDRATEYTATWSDSEEEEDDDININIEIGTK